MEILVLLAFWLAMRNIVPEKVYDIEGTILANIEGFVMENKFDAIYKHYGNIHGIDWRLIKAIAIKESSEIPDALGDYTTDPETGEKTPHSFGLMQVQGLIGRAYANISSVKELLDPWKNIEAGAGFLAHLISRYGVEGALEAYNLGETKYDKGLHSDEYRIYVMKKFEMLSESLEV